MSCTKSGATIWLTGLSGAGKSTLAGALRTYLNRINRACTILDGDEMRQGLCRDLGFSQADRAENVRRIGEVASLFTQSGLIAIVALVSPYHKDRQQVRQLHQAAELPFMEVFIDAPLMVCERRDVKGFYQKARAGEVKQFTGVSDPYEVPENPELILKTELASIDDCLGDLVQLLVNHHLIENAPA